MAALVRVSLFCLTAGAVLLIYLQGLPGGFILDDYPNLEGLVRVAQSPDLAALGSFIFANPSGDLGRPLPMLSFALQAAAWPGNPEHFKLVNIALHALNGILLFACLDKLLQHPLPVWRRRMPLAMVLALLWTLHPLHVSTVLYTVQRMTELAATFMLAGLFLYLRGRVAWSAGNRQGLWGMVSGVLLGSLLAALSKENGVLFPLAVAVLEVTVFAGERRGRAWWLWLILCILVPLLIVFGYIAWKFTIWILPGYQIRDFDLAERLWTEARVLWSYLGAFVFPQSASLGLFHDDYPLSRGWLSPVATLLSCLAWGGVLLAAFVVRHRFSGFSLAVFWFLGMHSLESGPIPLEIYFEHRNYFPLVGVILGLGWELGRVSQHVPFKGRWGSGRWPLAVFLGGWLCYFTIILVGEVRLWARPEIQAEVWASEHPDSHRARAYLAQHLFNQGFVEAAGRRYGELEVVDPGYVLYRQLVRCRLEGSLQGAEWQEAVGRLRTMPFSRVVIKGMAQLVELVEHGTCLEYTPALIDETVAALMENPVFHSRRYHILVLQGRLRVAQGRYREADVCFATALKHRMDVEVAMLRVKAAFLDKDFDRADELLEEVARLDGSGRFGGRIYGTDIEDWRQAIKAGRLEER